MHSRLALPHAVLVATAIAGLAACTTINPRTAAKLSTLSPLEADPAALRVAMRLPAPLELSKGDARLAIAWAPNTTPATRQEYKLDVSELSGAGAAPVAAIRQGEKIVVLTLADTDIVALRAFQQKIRADKARGGQGKGSITVAFSGGCWRGAFPGGARRLPFEVWLQTAPAQDYLPIIQGADLQQVLTGESGGALRSCP